MDNRTDVQKSVVSAVLSHVAQAGSGIVSLLSGLLAAFLILYSGFVLYDTFYTQDQAFGNTWELLQYRPEIIEDGAVPLDGTEMLAQINEDYRAWLKGGAPDARPPEGESAEELCIRSYRALNRILLDMMENDFQHCAAITHSGVISNMLACFGMPKIPAKELRCEPGEGFEILFTAQLWQTAQAFEILGMTPYSRG